jgi:hypothetical protein
MWVAYSVNIESIMTAVIQMAAKRPRGERAGGETAAAKRLRRNVPSPFRQKVFFLFRLSYRSASDLACKRPVRPITVFFFFVRVLVYFISLSFVSSSAAPLPFLF